MTNPHPSPDGVEELPCQQERNDRLMLAVLETGLPITETAAIAKRFSELYDIAWNTRPESESVTVMMIEQAVVAYLKDYADMSAGSGSDFNQGVTRGLEIAFSQIENGHHRSKLSHGSVVPNE